MKRQSRRNWFVVLGLFVAVFLFTFLTQSYKNNDKVEAASLASFDPGYIISDYQMGNYNSMNEAAIQNFLKSKGNCNDTRTYLAKQYTKYSYHIKNGHFVCLADETFGEGTAYGDQAPKGESAAHIIYRAAQDYKINPQVLIVLLQKEQGLITDSWPNNVQYRSATGYGCPDTAPCSSEYYGFKNQVRKAAAMFRSVLNGGWTNYPLGNNYIQYNPNAACGGSVVNIRSLATSALYRYTPYQPNAGALAAGYGTASCGAYGNRNFYLYFQDWFGNITGNEWQNMASPRVMKITKRTLSVNPITMSTYSQWAEVNYKYYFTSKIEIFWNGQRETCLRTAEDTRNRVNRCIIMSRMAETNEPLYNTTKINQTVFLLNKDTYKYDLKANESKQQLKAKDYYGISFSAKVSYNGKTFYQTTHDVNNGINLVVPGEALKEIKFQNFLNPRNMTTNRKVDFIDISNGKKCKSVNNGYSDRFVMKIDFGGNTYFRTQSETDKKSNCVINSKYVVNSGYQGSSSVSASSFKNFMNPRFLNQKEGAYLTDVKTGKSCDYVASGVKKKYTTKIDVGGKTFYRDETNSKNNTFCAMEAKYLREV